MRLAEFLVCLKLSLIFFCKAKQDCAVKTREMFHFLHLTNSSVTTGLSFLLLSKSGSTSLRTIKILGFLLVLCSSIFLKTSPISFEYLIKALISLRCFKPVISRLLIKNWCFASHGSLAYNKFHQDLFGNLLD